MSRFPLPLRRRSSPWRAGSRSPLSKRGRLPQKSSTGLCHPPRPGRGSPCHLAFLRWRAQRAVCATGRAGPPVAHRSGRKTRHAGRRRRHGPRPSGGRAWAARRRRIPIRLVRSPAIPQRLGNLRQTPDRLRSRGSAEAPSTALWPDPDRCRSAPILHPMTLGVLSIKPGLPRTLRSADGMSSGCPGRGKPLHGVTVTFGGYGPLRDVDFG